MDILDKTSAPRQPSIQAMQTSAGTLSALCGPDEIYADQLVLIASLWRDDLSGLDKAQLRARHFPDEKLRILASLVIGSIATFGVNDIDTMRRLLVTHHGISEQWVDITLSTIERVADLLIESDVAAVWKAVA